MECILAFCAWTALTTAQSQTRFTVNWVNDRLSVRAEDAPLFDVVAEVARLTGLKVVGAEKLQGRLTVDFTELAAVDALKSLLTEVNYFVQHESGVGQERLGLIVRVHSMAKTTAATVSAVKALRVPAIDAIIESEAEDRAEELEDELDDPDVEEENKKNLQAAQELALNGAFGKAVAPRELWRYMKHENPEIRLEAIKALAQRPISDSLTPLVEAVADDSIEVRRTAIDALGHASDAESMTRIGLVLEKDPVTEARYGALRIVALRADPAAIVHLRKAATDEDLMIREAVAQLLAEFQRLAREKTGQRPPPR